jgi:pimeloyl-ACP methyl ester carboxylesterase
VDRPAAGVLISSNDSGQAALARYPSCDHRPRIGPTFSQADVTATHDLVLLHGALGASTQFDALARSVEPHFRVHLLDFEGHGSAPPRGRPFRIPFFSENVLELLDSRRIERALLFGYSMGGYVALHLALEHPGRVARVATLGTKLYWDPQTATLEAARLDPSAIRAKVPKFAEALAARHEQAGGWERVLADTADLLRDLGDHPLLSDMELRRITRPVHIVVGDRDATVGLPESAAASRSLIDGMLTVLADTPHPLERVDLTRLVPLLVDFFLQATPERQAGPHTMR